MDKNDIKKINEFWNNFKNIEYYIFRWPDFFAILSFLILFGFPFIQKNYLSYPSFISEIIKYPLYWIIGVFSLVFYLIFKILYIDYVHYLLNSFYKHFVEKEEIILDYNILETIFDIEFWKKFFIIFKEKLIYFFYYYIFILIIGIISLYSLKLAIIIFRDPNYFRLIILILFVIALPIWSSYNSSIYFNIYKEIINQNNDYLLDNSINNNLLKKSIYELIINYIFSEESFSNKIKKIIDFLIFNSKFNLLLFLFYTTKK